jgi:hypothetical protein
MICSCGGNTWAKKRREKMNKESNKKELKDDEGVPRQSAFP